MERVASQLTASRFNVLKSANSERDASSSMPKWKVALIVGIPVAIGAGVVYYLYRRSKGKRKKVMNLVADQRTTPKQIDKNTPNANDVKEDPFSKAMSAKNSGNRYFKAGKYQKAIECYTEAIRLCPDDKNEDLATFYQNRAASYEMLKNYSNVIEDCTSAFNFNRKYIKALQRRAKAYESIESLDEALTDITAVCILEHFQNQPNLIMTDRILRQKSKARAKEFIRQRIPQMPSDPFIRHYFMSYTKHPLIDDPNITGQKLEEMLKELSSNNSDPERDAKIGLIKGTINILKGDIKNGEIELDKVAKLDNCDKDIKVNALIKLGTLKVHEIDGNAEGLKNSMECFEEALKLDPENADIYIHRAQIYLLGEQIDEAKSDLEKCCSLAPSFPSAIAQKLYVKFRCAVRFNDEDGKRRTMRDFEEAIRKFPKSSEVYSLYAQSLMEQQEYERADENFLSAIKCDPNDANLYVHRGILQLQWTNSIEKAVKLLEKALETDDKCQFAYEMLGSIEVQRGNLQKGIDCFEKALSIAQTELDCTHLFALRDAAEAQFKAVQALGIELPTSS